MPSVMKVVADADGATKKQSKNQRTLGAFFAPRKASASIPASTSILTSTPKSKSSNAMSSFNRSKAIKSAYITQDSSKAKVTPASNPARKALTASTKKPDKKVTNASARKRVTPSTSTKTTTTKVATIVAKTKLQEKASRKSPDKEALMEIVLGPMVDDSTIDTMPDLTELPYHPSMSDLSPLPRPGIRNPGLSRGRKRDSKSLVTPSPMLGPGPTHSINRTNNTNKKTKPSTEDEPVKENLLEKLDKSVDENDGDDMPTDMKCEQISNIVTEEGIEPLTAEETAEPITNAVQQQPSEQADETNVVVDVGERQESTNANGKPDADATNTKDSKTQHEVINSEEENQEPNVVIMEVVRLESTSETATATKKSTLDFGIPPKVTIPSITTEELVAAPPLKETKSATTNTEKPTTSPSKETQANEAPIVISEEIKSILKKHSAMSSRYEQRARELVKRGRDGLEEEQFQLPKPNELKTDAIDGTATTTEEFPDCAVQALAVIIQGSQLPLPQLAETSIQLLQESSSGLMFTTEAVATKIKLLAKRDSYTGTDVSKTNVFEDTDSDRMWRWELASLDLLPDDYVLRVKKARSARRKLKTHHRAISKLLSSIEEGEKVLLDGTSKKERQDAALAKISLEETKVLKFEREEEILRLKEHAKIKKELQKQKEKEQKQKEKEEVEETKRKEKASRDEEKQRKKEQVEKAKEESKKQKEEEREKEKQKREEEVKKELFKKEAKTKKQKAIMKSFFSTSTARSPSRNANVKSATVLDASQSASFDTEKFLSMINSREEHDRSSIFGNLSERAIASRKRRTRPVTLSVFVTVTPDNVFSPQPYDEQRDIQVQNKYKFLAFHEDHRPPYHGTWSKPRSKLVSGKAPFGKDTTHLDYEYDSEAEWEEGDEDPGEDCENDAGNDDDEEEENVDDEEGDSRVYNYQDGWMAADDDLGQDDEDFDQESKALHDKNLISSQGNTAAAAAVGKNKNDIANDLSTVCVIAPAMGGIPITLNHSNMKYGDDNDMRNMYVEGVAMAEAVELLSSHQGIVCDQSIAICLDPFPPELVDERPSGPSSTGELTSTVVEMSQDNIKTFAEFVHHCTLPSKDKLVEELRNAHKDITSSRAQATRKLDSIAIKQKHPTGGSVWVVKKEILMSLGLKRLLENKLEQPPPKEADAKPKKPKAKENKKSAKPKKPKVKEVVKSPAAAVPKAAAKANIGNKKKRVAPEPSKASANLFAAFLKKQKTNSSK